METKREVFESTLMAEHYTRYRHPSGLTVYVFRKEAYSAGAYLVVNAGALDRRFRPGSKGEWIEVPAGSAHYLEHVMFSLENGEDALTLFSRIGANANAYTSFDSTVYYYSMADSGDAYYEALSLLLTFPVRHAFPEKAVEKERPIIAEEIAMCADEPGETLVNAAFRAMYREHPVRDSICGSGESLSEITYEGLRRFADAFYRPDNMLLVLEGNIDEERVLSLCDSILPAETEGMPHIERFCPEEPPLPAKKRNRASADTVMPLAAVSFKDQAIPEDPAERMKKSETLGLLTDLLFSGTSHFYNELYDSGLIGTRFSVDYECSETLSYVMISSDTRDPEEFIGRVRGYIADRQRLHDITTEAFERCRRVMYASNVMAFETVGGSMPVDCANIALDGGELFAQIDIMMRITPDELFALLDTYFSEDACAVSIVYPLNTENGKDENKK